MKHSKKSHIFKPLIPRFFVKNYQEDLIKWNLKATNFNKKTIIKANFVEISNIVFKKKGKNTAFFDIVFEYFNMFFVPSEGQFTSQKNYDFRQNRDPDEVVFI